MKNTGDPFKHKITNYTRIVEGVRTGVLMTDDPDQGGFKDGGLSTVLAENTTIDEMVRMEGPSTQVINASIL